VKVKTSPYILHSFWHITVAVKAGLSAVSKNPMQVALNAKINASLMLEYFQEKTGGINISFNYWRV